VWFLSLHLNLKGKFKCGWNICNTLQFVLCSKHKSNFFKLNQKQLMIQKNAHIKNCMWISL